MGSLEKVESIRMSHVPYKWFSLLCILVLDIYIIDVKHVFYVSYNPNYYFIPCRYFLSVSFPIADLYKLIH